MEWSLQQSSEVKARPKNGRVLAIAAAVLCAAALSQPNLAYAGPHGGGGGGFHGGGFGGFHGRFAAMHEGFGGRHEGFGERHEGFRDRRGFVGGLGFGYYGYPYGGDYNYPDYGYYDYSQPYSSQTWYYCWDPAGYYPYVTQCNTGWQAVPAS